ncbi:ABC transporter [Streptomyces actuosus]|uniref:ABC transporter n=1 Tax=Streptomyces actuosus TaxID=1885 RepID=A0A2U9PDM6_STRAS|nr:ABC transporter [Streptomyces actuosus]MBM4820788.1 ABC transporter [Streptomyces actuosus]
MFGALIRPTVRALPRGPLLAGAVTGLLVAALPRVLPDLGTTPETGAVLLRVSALAMALGLAFLLDDPSRVMTETTPAGRPLRVHLRAALLAPLAALAWSGALLLIPRDARPPLADVTLEAVTLTATALALAAATVRTSAEPEPGRAAAVGLLALVVGGMLLPDRWGLFVAPGSPQWDAAHGRWAAVLAAAVIVWAVSVPEPLRRGGPRTGGIRASAGC